MPTSGRRKLGWWLSWTGLCVVLLTATTASALDLRVQGRSKLSSDLRAAGTKLLVSGQLRDDLEQPLPHREIEIGVLGDVTREEVAGRSVETDSRGRYSTMFDLEPGEYFVRSTFEATPHVVGTQTERTIQLQPEPVDLEVRGPALVRPTEGPVEIQVQAEVGGLGVPLPTEIRRAESGVLREDLDENGRGRIDVSSLLRSGLNQIRVRIPGDSYREPVEKPIRIRLADSLSVEARVESVFERFQRGAAVSGRVVSDGEPVPNARVHATLERMEGDTEGGTVASRPLPSEGPERDERERSRFEQSGTTGEDGTFHLLFSREELIDGAWRARLQVHPDLGAPLEREVGTVEIDRTYSRIVVYGAAGVALLAVLLVVLREVWRLARRKIEFWRRQNAASEKRRQAFEEEATLEAVPVAEEPRDSGVAGESDAVRGQVWDVWRERPVGGARVTLAEDSGGEGGERSRTDSDGYFRFDDLDSGSWELIIEAEYFVRGRFSFDVPHDGRLDPCRFELLPVPLKIRRLYQSLVELAHGEDLWGRLPPSEIRETVSRVLDATSSARSDDETPFLRSVRRIADGELEDLDSPRGYLDLLTGLVEETYFGPRDYGEKTWRVARTIALELREKLEDDAAV